MSATHYTVPAVVLHWLVALLIFVAFPLGLVMHELPLSPTKLRLYSWHKWIGVTVLALALLRALWRATHTPPAPLALADWERRLSALTHAALYTLIIVVPLTGWLMSSAKGFQTVWFGVLPLPDLVAKNRELGEALAEAHKILNFVMAGLVFLHVAGALKHQFVDRQPLQRRMGFGARA